LEFSTVKTYDDFTIYYDHGRRPPTEFLDQFRHGSWVLSHISIRERNLVMRKKLFR
jgi:hypothetical protein